VAARLGDAPSAHEHFRRLASLSQTPPDPLSAIRLDLALESYDDVAREVRPLLASPRPDDFGDARWLLLIALRNQGRLAEATRILRTGVVPGLVTPNSRRDDDDANEAILALERGEPGVAASIFERRRAGDLSRSPPGMLARHLAWSGTLQGMALAAMGDTVAVRALADSVEVWGGGSAYGRDRKAYHYLRGLVLAAAGRHEDAAREYRAAIHSPTLGFTRANLELARCLIQLGQPREAVLVLQSALRGDVDASNLYVTRTELRELMAHAFDRAGERDSAAVQYRAVVKAWAQADPMFASRRAAAQNWLARFAPATTAVAHARSTTR